MEEGSHIHVERPGQRWNINKSQVLPEVPNEEWKAQREEAKEGPPPANTARLGQLEKVEITSQNLWLGRSCAHLTVVVL